MKIIYWNIQGAKKPQSLGELRYTKRKINPDIMILTETLTSKENTKRIISKIGFDSYDYVNPNNHQGGFWIL